MFVRAAAALTSIALATSAASAQVVYEPVRVQYGTHQSYYYAGDNPAIHEAAAFPSAPGAAWGRVGGWAFVSPRRVVEQRNVRVFTDAFGTQDAAPFGLTPDQVTNEAYARIPRYFRKSDLLLAAETRDGSWIVAPTAPLPRSAEAARPGSIQIRPWRPPLFPRGPLFRRGPVMVIPKDMMDRKVGQTAPAHA